MLQRGSVEGEIRVEVPQKGPCVLWGADLEVSNELTYVGAVSEGPWQVWIGVNPACVILEPFEQSLPQVGEDWVPGLVQSAGRTPCLLVVQVPLPNQLLGPPAIEARDEAVLSGCKNDSACSR